MKRFVKIVMCSTALLLSDVDFAWGQGCVVCTRTGENQDATFAKGLNKGILFLAFLPLGIISTVGIMWWKRRK